MTALDDDGTTIRCAECGRRYRALVTHLARTHAMSTGEYREAHGLARTVPLVSAASLEVRSAIGRRRRDEDPRVLAALQGPGARAERAGPFPAREKRASTVAATGAAAAERAAARWARALEVAGWSSWADAAAWASAERVGWAAVAARMGTAQTATRRAGEAAGVRLERSTSPRTTVMLEQARAHAVEHGDLTDTTGDLAAWLGSRRYLARAGGASAVDDELERIDPAWRGPRRA